MKAAPFDPRWWKPCMQPWGFCNFTPGVWECPMHNGIDFYLEAGSRLFACVDGVVSWNPNWTLPGKPTGWAAVLDGYDGVRYTYGHISARPTIGAVRAGDPIALSGGVPGQPGAGFTTGAHLHFSMGPERQTVNPMPYLRAVFAAPPPIPAGYEPMTNNGAFAKAREWFLVVLRRQPNDTEWNTWAGRILKAHNADKMDEELVKLCNEAAAEIAVRKKAGTW